MKTHVLFLLLAAAVSGCIPMEDDLIGGPSRTETGRDGQTPAPGRPTDVPKPSTATDTILYYTAVRYPASYDWQRDTAYGNSTFELLLCRNNTTLLTLPSGPQAPFCPDPDRHHILNGHLYTERMLGSETLIGRDGEELFRIEGREFLVGLLEEGDDLLTLSRPAAGHGFSYRRNGKTLLTRLEGTPYGNLTDPSYGPSGALYRDNGQAVFFFRSGYVNHVVHYLVRDGDEIPLDNILPTANILDIKLHGSSTFTLSPSFFKHLMYEGRVWPEESGYSITGRFSDGKGGYIQGLLPAASWTTLIPLCTGDFAYLYHSPEATYAVKEGPDGSVRWFTPEEEFRSEAPCYLFSAACATLAGRRFVIALNPKNIHEPPRILYGDRVLDTGLYGYVSRVALEINLPN